MNILKKVAGLITQFRLNRAIRKAERLHKTTRFNYLVVNWKGKPKVFQRSVLKQLIAGKYFKKGIKISDFEKSAIYKTY